MSPLRKCVLQFVLQLTGRWLHRTVKCTKHNWKLDLSTMKYVNPPDSFLQDELGKLWGRMLARG